MTLELDGHQQYSPGVASSGGLPIFNGPIKHFERIGSYGEYAPIDLVSVPPGGDRFYGTDIIPRERGFAVGLGVRDKVVVAYPESVDHSVGFHDTCQAIVKEILGSRVRAILTGAIRPITPRREKGAFAKRATRHITIFKMHPQDRDTLTSQNDIFLHELGKIMPESFLTDDIAQRMLWGLSAHTLAIQYGGRSKEISRRT